jgi:hypothetical protein
MKEGMDAIWREMHTLGLFRFFVFAPRHDFRDGISMALCLLDMKFLPVRPDGMLATPGRIWWVPT